MEFNINKIINNIKLKYYFEILNKINIPKDIFNLLFKYFFNIKDFSNCILCFSNYLYKLKLYNDIKLLIYSYHQTSFTIKCKSHKHINTLLTFIKKKNLIDLNFILDTFKNLNHEKIIIKLKFSIFNFKKSYKFPKSKNSRLHIQLSEINNQINKILYLIKNLKHNNNYIINNNIDNNNISNHLSKINIFYIFYFNIYNNKNLNIQNNLLFDNKMLYYIHIFPQNNEGCKNMLYFIIYSFIIDDYKIIQKLMIFILNIYNFENISYKNMFNILYYIRNIYYYCNYSNNIKIQKYYKLFANLINIILNTNYILTSNFAILNVIFKAKKNNLLL